MSFKNNTMFGFFKDSGDYELRLETDTLDFGQRGMKTLAVVEAGMQYTKGVEPAELAVKYKYNYSDEGFDHSRWKVFNREGVMYPMITASEMRVLVRAPDYRNSKASISYLNLRLKLSDKRSIRGRFNVNAG